MEIYNGRTPYEIVVDCYYMDESEGPLTWAKAQRIANYIYSHYGFNVTDEYVSEIWAELDAQALFEKVRCE